MVLAHWSRTENPVGKTWYAQASEVTRPPPVDVVQPRPATSVNQRAKTFSHCGVVRRTCVVDGDTFWFEGQKIRIADIDTPEVNRPQCGAEKALGDRATNRLVVLLNEGPFEMTPIGSRDEDQFGRKLRVIVRDGRSIGDQLVAEGLARTWTGQREPWC
jgi:endonuclease YncB( thermonuclease family)